MASLALGVKFNAASGGTGDFVDASSIAGYVRAAGTLVDGKTYRYRAENPSLTEWEWGTGVWNASTSTLTRATVALSSTGAKVSFTAAPMIGVIPFVQDILQFDDAMSLTDVQQAQGRANLFAAPFDAMAYGGIQLNGAFDVGQESGGNIISNSAAYVADMWAIGRNGPCVLASQVVADAPPGITNSLKITVTTADATMAATSRVAFTQVIEGYRWRKLCFGTSAALPVTLSFYVKAHRPGMYSGTVLSGAGNRGYPFTYTINTADTWEYKTVTIPGDTAGTWTAANTVGAYIFFALGAGANWTAPAGAWAAGSLVGANGTINGAAATSDVFQITGLAVIPGLQAPPASAIPALMRPYPTELFECQRYYWKAVAGSDDFLAAQRNGGDSNAEIFYPNTMRAAPTLSFTWVSATGSSAIVRSGVNSCWLVNTPATAYITNFVANARL